MDMAFFSAGGRRIGLYRRYCAGHANHCFHVDGRSRRFTWLASITQLVTIPPALRPTYSQLERPWCNTAQGKMAGTRHHDTQHVDNLRFFEYTLGQMVSTYAYGHHLVMAVDSTRN